VANTITLLEPNVETVMLDWAGLQLERALVNTGPWTNLGRQAYVVGQTQYVFEDLGGTPTSWYRSARYTALDTLGPYSPAFPAAPPLSSSVTLASIEREVARRIGPFYELSSDQQSPSTITRAYFPGLQSTIEQDLVANLWLLRRGVDWQGAPVPVDTLDRQRTVAVYDALTGSVQVDRAWGTPLAPGEVCEFHHLNPEQQLRPAVRAGLRRCVMEDRFGLAAGYIYEVDLTEAVPWLTNPRQVTRVQAANIPQSLGRVFDVPHTIFVQNGHVCLRVNAGRNSGAMGNLIVTTWRAVDSLVNGLTTTSGPLADADRLQVHIDYAAAAGHIEAWHLAPAMMQAAAAGGLQMTRDQAALEFTRQARVHVPRRPDLFQMVEGFGSFAGPVVINA